MKKVVLITGANGFVGSYATLFFESQGHRIIPLDIHSRSRDLSTLPIEAPTQILDVTDYAAVSNICRKEDVTHIIHLAQPSRKEDPKILNLSFLAIHNILETAKAMPVERVVFASSGAIYGQLRKKNGQPIREDDPVAIFPTFLYRSSKILGEWLGDFYIEHHGVSFTALRFSSVYGPGQAKGIGAEIKQGILGHECRPYLTRVPDDSVFIKDVVRSIFIACFKELPIRNSYNIAYGEPCFERDLEAAIRKKLPNLAFEIVKHPELSSVGRHRQRDILDISLARDELGFVPEFSLYKGIAEIADWVNREKENLN